ncbi:MAG: hypothetical protein GY720_06225 [bacterium]|nr:hypothetical protein [bacterium]
MAYLRMRALVVMLLLGLGLTGCGTSGSGTIVSSVRSVTEFDGIVVSDGLSVELDVAAGTAHSVTVNYDDNIIDQVITRVTGGVLVIEFDGSVNFSGSGRSVVVTMPRLASLDASGGASVSAEGMADRISIEASGGSSISTGGLQAAHVTLDVSGGASVTVYAMSSATGEASGGSSVSVLGSPGVFDIDSSGGSSVSGG